MWQFHTGFSIRSIFEIMRDSHEALLLQEVDGDVTCSRGDVTCSPFVKDGSMEAIYASTRNGILAAGNVCEREMYANEKDETVVKQINLFFFGVYFLRNKCMMGMHTIFIQSCALHVRVPHGGYPMIRPFQGVCLRYAPSSYFVVHRTQSITRVFVSEFG